MGEAEKYVKSKFPEASCGNWKIVNGSNRIEIFFITTQKEQDGINYDVIAGGSNIAEAWHNAAVKIVEGYENEESLKNKLGIVK